MILSVNLIDEADDSVLRTNDLLVKSLLWAGTNEGKSGQ
jgi:hypothetical protein